MVFDTSLLNTKVRIKGKMEQSMERIKLKFVLILYLAIQHLFFLRERNLYIFIILLIFFNIFLSEHFIVKVYT